MKQCYLQSSIIFKEGSKCHRSLISAQAHSYSQISLAFLSLLVASYSHLGMESPLAKSRFNRGTFVITRLTSRWDLESNINELAALNFNSAPLSLPFTHCGTLGKLLTSLFPHLQNGENNSQLGILIQGKKVTALKILAHNSNS